MAQEMADVVTFFLCLDRLCPLAFLDARKFRRIWSDMVEQLAKLEFYHGGLAWDLYEFLVMAK